MPIYTKNNNIIKLSGIYIGNSSKNPIQISKVYRGDSSGTPILVYSSHTHSYGTSHTKESDGVYYVTCSCGDKKYCDVRSRSAQSATCTTNGHTAGYYCYDHYSWRTGSSISKLDHTYVHNVIPDNYSIHNIECSNCNYSNTKSHAWVNKGTGLSIHCSECGIQCSHNWQLETGTDASCLTGGSTTYRCTICNDSYTEAISALGHVPPPSPSATYIIESATCQHGNIYNVICTRCRTNFNYDDGNIQPHNDLQVEKAFCGCDIHYCSWCGKTVKRVSTYCNNNHSDIIYP